MFEIVYTVRVMGEGGYFYPRRIYKTASAAKAAATRIMRNLGADIVGAGAQVYAAESNCYAPAELIASRGYFTNWREE